MGIRPNEPTKLRILFFLFYLSIGFSVNSHAQDFEEKATKQDALNSVEPKNSTAYSAKQPSLVLFNRNISDRLKLSAKEVSAKPGEGSVFISPRIEFALGDFAYVSESDKALTDYRPASDGSISLTGSVKLIRYSSNAKHISITSDLLAIDLPNEKITGTGSVKLLIGDSAHTGANFSIERAGIFRLRGEDSSRIKGEIHLTPK